MMAKAGMPTVYPEKCKNMSIVIIVSCITTNTYKYFPAGLWCLSQVMRLGSVKTEAGDHNHLGMGHDKGPGRVHLHVLRARGH